mmetsp:Transcript_84890/g.274434  ORF Transcript_84890/g.274434 Transcript_84890/m.274434 type:complete len:85 (+) Transcript_84890:955-1209(+)
MELCGETKIDMRDSCIGWIYSFSPCCYLFRVERLNQPPTTRSSRLELGIGLEALRCQQQWRPCLRVRYGQSFLVWVLTLLCFMT